MWSCSTRKGANLYWEPIKYSCSPHSPDEKTEIERAFNSLFKVIKLISKASSASKVDAFCYIVVLQKAEEMWRRKPTLLPLSPRFPPHDTLYLNMTACDNGRVPWNTEKKHRFFNPASSCTCFSPWDIISFVVLTQFTIYEEEKEGKRGGKGGRKGWRKERQQEHKYIKTSDCH